MKTLFEVSFEVCNKVGGIYTVVSSKVPYVQHIFDRYFAIGPWFSNKAVGSEFIQYAPDHVPSEIQAIFDELFKKGIYCTYGVWNIEGKPETILINPEGLKSEEKRNWLKKKYWDYFQVDSINARYDFDEPMIFATAVGMFVEEYVKQTKMQPKKENESFVLQCHEWMTGFAGLYLKAKEFDEKISDSSIWTTFTTHATMLGRSLVARGKDPIKLSKNKSFDPLQEAKEIGIIEKHSTEYACAHNLDSFTTVSNITQKEANALYAIKPALTYNGLNLKSFSKGRDLIAKHHASRTKIITVLKNLFSEEDFADAFLLYTSGRPEFHNKGFDALFDALLLLQDNSTNKIKKKIVCFFLVPWQHYERKNSLKNSITTHWLNDEENHPLIKQARERGFTNTNQLKVILYPCYLGTPEDTLFSKDYYDLVSGFDLGVFNSSYEPWGYTPLECIATGVPTLTSNQTGFGQFVSKKKITGVEVFAKEGTLENEAKQLAKVLSKYVHLDDQQRIVLSLAARDAAEICDWKTCIEQYKKAYNIK